jgi:imidazolonepropionase-like amidohydrolase
MKNILVILFCFGSLSLIFGQDYNRILILDGELHVGNGIRYASAAIGIEDGKISFVKNSLAMTIEESEWDTIIRMEGKHIYPGFVAPNSTLGITEIDAVRATRDFDEVGSFNPHIRTQIAFNVESKVISTVRTNGVLLTQSTPRGGWISGSSSVMKMDGWNWEDATVKGDDGIHLNWPQTTTGGGWWAEPAPKKGNDKYKEQKQKIYEFFEIAKAYSETNSPEKFDLRLESMKKCFKGSKRVYVHADELQQLLDVIEFAQHFDLSYPVIIGGYDANLIMRQLVDAEIPVMVQRPHGLPETEGDDVDHLYKLPALLQDGGVKFCIQNAGDMEAMGARNIPFLAGTAFAYGLKMEEAISSVSLWSCEIMGVDKHYGSIERGKSATLFVSDGNALDMMSNNIVLALIDGKFMSLDNDQKELYRKYSEKYASEKK